VRLDLITVNSLPLVTKKKVNLMLPNDNTTVSIGVGPERNTPTIEIETLECVSFHFLIKFNFQNKKTTSRNILVICMQKKNMAKEFYRIQTVEHIVELFLPINVMVSEISICLINPNLRLLIHFFVQNKSK